MAASSLYFSGVLLGAYSIHIHSLATLYLGYGFLAGAGLGAVYTPPL